MMAWNNRHQSERTNTSPGRCDGAAVRRRRDDLLPLVEPPVRLSARLHWARSTTGTLHIIALLVAVVLATAAYAQMDGADDTVEIPKPRTITVKTRTCDLAEHIHPEANLLVYDVADLTRANTIALTDGWRWDVRKWFWIWRWHEGGPCVDTVRHLDSLRRFNWDHPFLDVSPSELKTFLTDQRIGNAFATLVDGKPAVIIDPQWLVSIADTIQDRLATLGGPWAGLEKTGPDFRSGRSVVGGWYHNSDGFPIYEVRKDESFAAFVQKDVQWLVYFHEIGHIVLGHLDKRADVGTSVDREMEADAFAGFVLGMRYATVERHWHQRWRDHGDESARKLAEWFELLLGNRQRIIRETWMVLYQEEDNSHPSFEKRVIAVNDGFQLGWTIGCNLEGDDFDRLQGRVQVRKVREAIEAMRNGDARSTTIMSMDLVKDVRNFKEVLH